MEKENKINNPIEKTLLFQLFKMMVVESFIPEEIKERIRKNLIDIVDIKDIEENK